MRASLLLSALAALLIASPARAAVPAGNLLANPGAEAAPGATDSSGIVPPPGWTVDGNFTVVAYGTSAFPTVEEGAAIGGGTNFFAGGPGNDASAGAQIVNVSGAATEIDAGQVSMTLAALLGGYETQEDAATVTASALDAAGAVIGTASIGPVDSATRGQRSTMIARSATVAVPAGTRLITVRIAATRTEGDYNDGYIDNVSLSLLGAPVAGKSVNGGTLNGAVCVKRPGSGTCVPLGAGERIPLGSTVDARKGVVEITAGPNDKAKFYDGIFKLSQKGGVTTLTLTEALASCKGASSAAKKPQSRKLWGDGKGSFRTQGKYSAATIRGTKWLVQDSCAGTLTRVAQGAVTVRDDVRKRNVVVRAGKSYTARPRR